MQLIHWQTFFLGTLTLLLNEAFLSGNHALAQEMREPMIVMNVDELPYTLIPSKATDSAAAWMLQLLGNRLVNTNGKDQIFGDLASHWEISNDQKTYNFYLRKDAVFWDKEPIDSRVVTESLMAAFKNTKSGYLYLIMAATYSP
jgi:ABC-type transport system substrate-binding protein